MDTDVEANKSGEVNLMDSEAGVSEYEHPPASEGESEIVEREGIRLSLVTCFFGLALPIKRNFH